MAHSILRSASMAINKKNVTKGSKASAIRAASSNGGRRYTMIPQPQPRDSVLSNGSSDCSSSVSDETALSPPLPNSCGKDFFSFDTEEQIREAWPLKCCFVVKEILQTEITYVHALGDIIKGYLTPLYSHLLNSGENPNFIKTVFSNIVKIHKTHQELIESFQNTFTSPHDFCSHFLHVDFLSLYTVYCTSFSQGNECLERSLHENDSLREFIESCQQNLGHSLPLSSQLIKPVQRILKYRLLLEELNKHFDHHHHDYKTIQDALEKMSSVAEQINTAFTQQKRAAKGVPSAVAKRRTHQIRELQVSRSMKGRRRSSPTHSPPRTRLGSRSVSETHLNHVSNNSDPVPTGYRWKTTNRKEQPKTSEARVISRTSDFENKSAGSCAISKSVDDNEDSLPNVKVLKSFFEKLGEEEGRRDSCGQRPDMGGMKKAKSMGGGKDSISSVGLSSPTKSPKWSPQWSPVSFSPVKSPIKVPVLPYSSPSKSPLKSPSKSPSKFSTLKSSTSRTPVHSPTSPTKLCRHSSGGSSTLDFGMRPIGGFPGRRVAGTQLDGPALLPTSRVQPSTAATESESAKALATRTISAEIRRHLAATKWDQAPRSMV